MKKHIPNFITLLNLTSGTLALLMVLSGKIELALYCMLASLIFDFLDGMSARALHVKSKLGGELDSLADLISFALVPAAMVYVIVMGGAILPGAFAIKDLAAAEIAALIATLTIPAFAALRLAMFNLQTDESAFLGLPTPAFALFWVGIYYDYTMNDSLFGKQVNAWFLVALIALMAILMVVPFPMLTLKFKNLKFQENISRYLILLTSLIIIALVGIPGVSVAVLVYILLSFFTLVFSRKAV